MDQLTIATISASAVALLAPYLAALGSGLAKRAGEEIGSKAAGKAWGAAEHLHDTVQKKLSVEPSAKEALATIEAAPHDETAQAEVRSLLVAFMSVDERFAQDVALLLKEASEAGVDSVFNTTIHGDVEKLTQFGTVFGDITI